MDIKIAYLKDHPEAIATLAKVWHEVLGSIWIPDSSLAQVEQRFHKHLNDKLLPLTLVALNGTQAIGAVSLRDNDGIRPDLTPWLASLIVDKAHQKCGIGKMLVDALKEKAKKLGFRKLYLFAFDPVLHRYYEQLGFKIIGMDRYKEHVVTVMESEL